MFTHFTVGEWMAGRGLLIDRVSRLFGAGPVIVRSSALDEDGAGTAMAGRYLSVQGIDPLDGTALAGAVDEVVKSMEDGGRREGDQVMVQAMAGPISMGGVVFTQDLNTGAPYYVINYDDESGRTDTVSSGTVDSANRTLLVHRGFTDLLHSPRFAALLEAVIELEMLTGTDCLDVEFAVTTDGSVHIFQARRITTQPNWNRKIAGRINEALETARRTVAERLRPLPGIHGSRSILGKMPDWNPVEMLGTTPRPLAASLYRALITDRVWRRARALMGYAEPKGQPLMVLLCGQPMIDVRMSFNSFLPAGLAPSLAGRLVDAWLDRLEENPHLHDKVEFEVAITARTPDFRTRVAAGMPGALSAGELKEFDDALGGLTRNLLTGRVAPIPELLGRIGLLEERRRELFSRDSKNELSTVSALLEDCALLGTLPFSMLARHAFVAEDFLRSLVALGAADEAAVTAFKNSVPTVAGDFVDDVSGLASGEVQGTAFLEKYGHLRPGTYEIQSLRYDRNQKLMESLAKAGAVKRLRPSFSFSGEVLRAVDALLGESCPGLGAKAFFGYAAEAIKAREYAKFIFTRALSDALEILALWGEGQGLSREEVSHLNIRDILDTMVCAPGPTADGRLRELADEGRENHRLGSAVYLPYLVVSEADVVIAPLLVSRPNFVTAKSARGERVMLDGDEPGGIDLSGKIVVIETADPGFDWIFAQPIKGLITKFGGANSHMTIRCAEFGLPAAIGCGEQIFNRVRENHWVELDCAARRIVPLEM